jgi:hypothetical protein
MARTPNPAPRKSAMTTPSSSDRYRSTAYVLQTGRDSYNMIIVNDEGAIVTAHRGMTFDDLSGLAQNYRWTGWP